MAKINEVDLAFITDTTGSMGTLIAEAKKKMVSTIEEVSKAADIDLRVAVVEYRDHPPQDTTPAKVHGFTDDKNKIQQTINKLSAAGGGDEPESVFDGLDAACTRLKWRPNAYRLAVLMGDAPPHGMGERSDCWAQKCPCGHTLSSITCLLEEHGIVLHSIGLTNAVDRSFTAISRLTGGTYSNARHESGIGELKKLLKTEFEDVDFDKQVLELLESKKSADDIASSTKSGLQRVWKSIGRLNSRGLIPESV